MSPNGPRNISFSFNIHTDYIYLKLNLRNSNEDIRRYHYFSRISNPCHHCEPLYWIYIADELLECGYRVRGSVRSHARAQWLLERFNHRYGNRRFELYVVEGMVKEGAYNEAVKGACLSPTDRFRADLFRGFWYNTYRLYYGPKP